MLFDFIFINFICIDLILCFVFKNILEIKEKMLENTTAILEHLVDNSIEIGCLDSNVLELDQEIKNMKNTKESEE